MRIDAHKWTPMAEGCELPAFPAGGEVHFWRIPLAGSPDLVRCCYDRLAPDERARAERFIPQRVRERFILCRSTVREILGGYLNQDPLVLEFRYGPYGKPALAGETSLRFNVSHSGDLALLAVTVDVEIGVDIERSREVENMLGLAERFFSAAESAQLRRVGGADVVQRREAFFSLWTCKESFLKAHGTGLSYPLSQFTVSLDELPSVRLSEIQGDAAAAATWSLALERPDRGYLAAFAMQGFSPHVTHRLHWRSSRR